VSGTSVRSSRSQDNSIHYYGARVHRQGRGFEGFRARRTHDSRNGLYAYEFLHRSFPYTGLRLQFDLYQPDGATLIERTEHTWSNHSSGTQYQNRWLPYVSQTNSSEYEFGGTFNAALIRTTSVGNTVDSTTGTLTDRVVTTSESASANGVQSGATFSQRTYHPAMFNDFVNWCIGRPDSTQHTSSHTQYGGGTQTRTIDTDWNGTMCRPTQMRIEPGDPQWQLTVAYGYDGYGNVQSESVTGAGMVTRTTTTTWGAPGTFPTHQSRPVSSTYSETSQISWDYALGVPLTQTNANGLSISLVYDALGRLLRTNRPDATAIELIRSPCNAGNGFCGDARLRYSLTTVLRNSANGVIRDDLQYFDAFDRLAYDQPRLLDGDRANQVTQYDAMGRVSAQSAPTLASSPQLFWFTRAYDALDRVIQEARPISDSDPTLMSHVTFYEGATTRTVDAQGGQERVVRNALGAPVRTVDAANYFVTFDHDAFGSTVRVQDSTGATLQSAAYNIRGMQTIRSDANLGTWTFVPNALGELVSQTDAKGQSVTFTYDRQSRLLSRTMPEGSGSITSTFTWGQSETAKNVGKLVHTQISGTGLTTYAEAFTFDSLGRPVQTQVTEGSNSYYVNTGYSGLTGMVDTLTYPTSTSGYRLKLSYEYQYGLLRAVRDFNSPSTVFWQADATEARGQVTAVTYGNGLRTTRSFDAVTGLVDYIRTGPGGGSSRQNLSYLWDKLGNLLQRQDGNQGLTENFYYDNVNRLESSQLNGTTNLEISYAPNGNVLSKTLVGGYGYHATKLHAVASIATGSATWAYAYDANGNMTSRNGTEITWFANNAVKRIRKTPGSTADSSEFQYAASGARWRHAYRKGSTLFTHVYIGGLLEKVTQGANVEWKHYIHAGGEVVALLERHSGGSNSQWYLLKDHLGSTDVITSTSGGVFVSASFDPYGLRRGAAWTGSPTATQINNYNTSTRRGFTFHEMLDSTGLIHMNGRVYEPQLGRFLSPDPHVPRVRSTQSSNRYSYASNSPLTRIDPSGYLDHSFSIQDLLGFFGALFPPPLSVWAVWQPAHGEPVWIGDGVPPTRPSGPDRIEGTTDTPVGDFLAGTLIGTLNEFLVFARNAAVADALMSGGAYDLEAVYLIESLPTPQLPCPASSIGQLGCDLAPVTTAVASSGVMAVPRLPALVVQAAGRQLPAVTGTAARGTAGLHRALSANATTKIPRAGLSAREAAKDIPSWARGERPLLGEKGRDFASRMLDAKYGAGNYPRGPGSEFSKIQKWADRAFEDPPGT